MRKDINDFQISEHFNLKEFACKCCNQVKIAKEVVDKLEVLRKKINKPIIINSGYRCEKYNAKVGGVKNSYHTQGLAVDIYVEGISLEELAKMCEEAGFNGIGIYLSKNFVHCDLGAKRKWIEK